MQVGSLVKALAGKEKGELFIVTRLDEGFAYIADGKRLKVQKPKKKSVKHLACLSQALSEEQLLLNSALDALVRKTIKQKRSDYV